MRITRRSFVAGSTALVMATGTAPALADNLATTADVIVVGAGASGLAAAAGAGESGASVIVLEAAQTEGGAARISGGHMAMLNEELNAAMERNDAALQAYKSLPLIKYHEFGTALITLLEQIAEYEANGKDTGRFDSLEMMLVDQYKSGLDGSGRLVDLDGVPSTISLALCTAALEHNMVVNDWLCEQGGMELEDTIYKTHGNTPVGKGAGLVEALFNCASAVGAQIVYGARATELIVEGGKVVGVVATAEDGTAMQYHANRGVVLATGSFSSNSEMCASYQRMGAALDANTPSDNVATNVGDGITMALQVDAQLRDMSFVNTILLGYQNGNTATEMSVIDGKQQLAVNGFGERFASDISSSTLTSPVGNEPGGICYYVGDKKMADAMEEKSAGSVDDYASRGWLFKADTLEQAAELAGLDSSTLARTVSTFNGYVATGIDLDFGRATFNGACEEPPFIVAKMQVHYHLTLGGVVVDEETRVTKTDGGTVPGLYAAGDLIWGIEGYTHQSGSNLTADVYFGKLAGQNAYAMGADDEFQVSGVPNEGVSLKPSQVVELPEDITSLCGTMVQLPGGTFMMGAPEGELFSDDSERPPHEVQVASFAVGAYPVTYAQYCAFVADTQREDPEATALTSLDGSHSWLKIATYKKPFADMYTPGDDDPVCCVSWQDAQDYVAWLCGKTGMPFRLLTEAEYEYAMRAGTTSPYYTGEHVTFADAQYGRHYGSRTVPSGTFAPNAWGLYGMMGNVWSWVEDDFNDAGYDGAPNDGSAWIIEGAEKKVVRGGSWNVMGEYLRSANRDGYAADTTASRVGFRIAMDVE